MSALSIAKTEHEKMPSSWKHLDWMIQTQWHSQIVSHTNELRNTTVQEKENNIHQDRYKKRTHRNKQANAGAVRRKQTCRRLGYRVTSTWSWAGQQHHEVRRDQTGEPCLAVTGPYAQHRPMLQNNNDYIYWQALIGCNCLTVASSGLLFNQTGSHISW